MKSCTHTGRLASLALPLLLAPAALAQTSVGHTDAISAGGDDGSYYPSLSVHGDFVAFQSRATNLVPMDNNGLRDIFVFEAQTATITRVSVGPAGLEANGNSLSSAISADGRFVAFLSEASNLVQVDGNGALDVFVHDRETGVTELVSVSLGGIPGNGASGDPTWTPPTISADGRFVAFHSDATDLVAMDNNGVRDVFVRDRQAQTTIRVSVDSTGVEGNAASEHAGVSPDGRWVAFQSLATNLDQSMPASNRDVYLHDLWTGTTTAITAGAVCSWPRPCWDAEYISFGTLTSLVAGDTNGDWDAYVHERASGTTSRVSVRSGGFQAHGSSGASAISHDGRLIAFQSTAEDLVLDDTNAVDDVFVHDRVTAVTTRVSVGTGGIQANGVSEIAAISPDGSCVGFQSGADNLFASDTNGAFDAFVHGAGSLGMSYCGPAVPNSTGFPASISASGLGVAGWRLTLVATDLPTKQFGYFLVSQTQDFIQNPAGSQGNLCLGGNIGRINSSGQVVYSGTSGSFELRIETVGVPVHPPQDVLSGESWNFQAWFRDTGGTNNFTDAVSITFE